MGWFAKMRKGIKTANGNLKKKSRPAALLATSRLHEAYFQAI
jgi:hypothetical protein